MLRSPGKFGRSMQQTRKRNAKNGGTKSPAEAFVFDKVAHWLAMNRNNEGRATAWKCSECGHVIQVLPRTQDYCSHGECPECKATMI